MALENICGLDKFSSNLSKCDRTIDPHGLSNPKFFVYPSTDPIKSVQQFINVDHNASDKGENGMKIRLNNGTTTLSFKYQGGIVVAVDSRATAGGYIASQTVNKVLEISPYILGTMAGGAADCQYWERVLAKICRIHELRNKDRMSVAAASKILANMMYNYKGMGLSMGTMICGWDKRYYSNDYFYIGYIQSYAKLQILSNFIVILYMEFASLLFHKNFVGPSIYYVDNDASRLHNHLFSVGSGSMFAYSILDAGWKWELTYEEALNLGIKAIFHATYRDAGSGGCVNLFHIKDSGWEKIGSYDVAELYYKYKEMGELPASF